MEDSACSQPGNRGTQPSSLISAVSGPPQPWDRGRPPSAAFEAFRGRPTLSHRSAPCRPHEGPCDLPQIQSRPPGGPPARPRPWQAPSLPQSSRAHHPGAQACGRAPLTAVPGPAALRGPASRSTPVSMSTLREAELPCSTVSLPCPHPTLHDPK